MERTTIDFGVDLGTTNSSIAVIDQTDARVLSNKVGATTTPSAVWIDKRGRVHVGEEAKQRALVTDRENAALEFKLQMGRGSEGKREFTRSGREMLPEELSAEVLKSLKTDVQSLMSEDLRAAVITVPAVFEAPQTKATREAATLAGFALSPLLLEPVAASLAYGFQSESENVYWLVYDFGGGTFDAAIMRVRDGLIQLVNHDGDNFLGGKLLDWDIVAEKLAPAAAAELNLPDFRRGNPSWEGAFGKMKFHAERAKIEVCRTRKAADIWIEGLYRNGSGEDVDFGYELTPEEVEEVSRPYIERSLDLCRVTLEEAGLSGSDMERILMVGGTTLNPWVREAVAAELSDRLEFGIDPITVVARGAAIFAGTQALPPPQDRRVVGGWRIEIEHKPVGNVPDPDFGGRVVAPEGESCANYTVELVDARTQWTTGRIPLAADGVFITQLFAEKQRRHEFAIKLCDPTGSQVPVSPDRVTYTIGVIPEENPPAVMTIGVGLADGGVAPYFEKGQKLPARRAMDHYTTVPLRAGRAEDELRIPVIEGEHARAERNHGVGALVIRGSDIHRDLPAGSQIEVTLRMDTSQQIKVEAYINSLDEDVPSVEFDPKMAHESLDDLRAEAERQRDRLKTAREQAGRTVEGELDELAKIGDQGLLEHVDKLIDAADGDTDAVPQLDRRLRELASAVDAVENAVEWPTLLADAEASRAEAERVAEAHGDRSDGVRLELLAEELERARQSRDTELVRHCRDKYDDLQFQVLDRQPGFHVARFEWLVERATSMRDPGQAERIIGQGRRAINNNDIDALKAANRQLLSLLPRAVQEEAKHKNIGHTMTRQ